MSKGLLDKFGDKRVIDTPITEMGFTGLAVGAAMAGLKPICEFMTWNFALQAIDQIVNSAAKTLYMSAGQVPVPVVFRGPNGAAAGVAAQHSQDFAAWYGSVPGMRVVCPWSAGEARGLLKAAIRDPNPTVFLEHELLYGQEFEVDQEEWNNIDHLYPLGKAKVLREGSDVTLVTYSRCVELALEAAEKMQNEVSISVEVINLLSLRPLDIPSIVESVKKTSRLVTLEAGWPRFGVGAEIIAAMQEEGGFGFLDAPCIRVTGADIPMPYSEPLERNALPALSDVIRPIRYVASHK